MIKYSVYDYTHRFNLNPLYIEITPKKMESIDQDISNRSPLSSRLLIKKAGKLYPAWQRYYKEPEHDLEIEKQTLKW